MLQPNFDAIRILRDLFLHLQLVGNPTEGFARCTQRIGNLPMPDTDERVLSQSGFFAQKMQNPIVKVIKQQGMNGLDQLRITNAVKRVKEGIEFGAALRLGAYPIGGK